MRLPAAVFTAVFAALSALLSPAGALAQGPALADAAFLAGHWRGEEGGLVFEEVWLAPEGGVMTGMARGVSDGTLAVLEYIIIADTPDGAYMRFEHFNPDYSTWEGEDGAIRLRFVEAGDGEALFRNEDPAAEVRSVRYSLTGEASMRAEVEFVEDGAPGAFSLSFEKVD